MKPSLSLPGVNPTRRRLKTLWKGNLADPASIDESATFHWPEGTEHADTKMVMPGDNVEMLCDTINPVAMETGQRFNVREGGRTVATGLITRLLN